MEPLRQMGKPRSRSESPLAELHFYCFYNMLVNDKQEPVTHTHAGD